MVIESKPKREMTTIWVAKATRERLKKLWQEQDAKGECKTYDDLISVMIDTLLSYLNEDK